MELGARFQRWPESDSAAVENSRAWIRVVLLMTAAVGVGLFLSTGSAHADDAHSPAAPAALSSDLQTGGLHGLTHGLTGTLTGDVAQPVTTVDRTARSTAKLTTTTVRNTARGVLGSAVRHPGHRDAGTARDTGSGTTSGPGSVSGPSGAEPSKPARPQRPPSRLGAPTDAGPDDAPSAASPGHHRASDRHGCGAPAARHQGRRPIRHAAHQQSSNDTTRTHSADLKPAVDATEHLAGSIGGPVKTIGTTVHHTTALIDAAARPDHLPRATADVVEDLGSVLGSTGKVVGSAGSVVNGAADTVRTIGNRNAVSGAVIGAVGDIVGSGGSAIGAIGDSLGTVGDQVGSAGDDLGSGPGPIGDGLGDLGDGVGDGLGSVVGVVGAGAPGSGGDVGVLPVGVLPGEPSAGARGGVDSSGSMAEPSAEHAGTGAAAQSDPGKAACHPAATDNRPTAHELILLRPAPEQQATGTVTRGGAAVADASADHAGFLGGPLGAGNDRHSGTIPDDLAAGTASTGSAGHGDAGTLGLGSDLCSGESPGAFAGTASNSRGASFDPGFSPD